jgi:hypothetical protein
VILETGGGALRTLLACFVGVFLFVPEHSGMELNEIIA